MRMCVAFSTCDGFERSEAEFGEIDSGEEIFAFAEEDGRHG
jgi:hypothetical protein